PGDEGAGDDRQVLRPAGQVGVSDGAAHAVPLGHLVEADALLLRSVEVVTGHGAAPDGRLDEKPGVLGLVPQVLHRQRAAGAVVLARAAGVVLGPAEVREQVVVPPPGAAVGAAPAVVVVAVAAQVDHRPDRGRADCTRRGRGPLRRRWRRAPPQGAAPGSPGPRQAGRPPRSPRSRPPRSRSRTHGYLTAILK